jgi:hypothetical protein
VTRAAARSQYPQPGQPAPTDEPARDSFFGSSEAPDTWTADAVYPADSPVRYTLTPQAETLLNDGSNPTGLLRNGHACGMRARDPQAGSGPSGQPRTYVTKISLPPSDSGIQRLHSRMKEPQPEPEAGL